MSNSAARLIVVTPVYEDLEASSRLFKELAAVFPQSLYVIAVDDGSVRQPLPISALEQSGVSGEILKLRRNVGHQRAISIGLGHASQMLSEDDRVIVMDSDGEDLPSTISALLSQLASNKVDVVVAQRRSRVETLKFKAFYVVYKHFFQLLTGRAISFGNFMAMKPAAVKRLVSMQELTIHVAAAVLASKLRVETCSLDRGPRYAGQSKMNFVGLALHGFKGLMVFAEDVLVRVGIACATIAAGSITGAIIATLLKVLGFSTPGWFSIALGILVLMFLQTGALALMTLMLTGVVRGGTVAARLDYQDFIETVLVSRAGTKSEKTPEKLLS